MAHPELTSEQALREAVKRARALLGEDFYMLSCAGAADREILFAIDLFDGARIGGDIFNWREFINDFVARVMRFYAYHNTETYCDPDNLVIRPEFNSLDQAVSRTSFLSVLGLPVTLGDNLPDLPPERVELLKRCLPALDAHPMDIRESHHESDRVIALSLIHICCAYHLRCPQAVKGLCDQVAPTDCYPDGDHRVACHLYADSAPSAPEEDGDEHA